MKNKTLKLFFWGGGIFMTLSVPTLKSTTFVQKSTSLKKKKQAIELKCTYLTRQKISIQNIKSFYISKRKTKQSNRKRDKRSDQATDSRKPKWPINIKWYSTTHEWGKCKLNQEGTSTTIKLAQMFLSGNTSRGDGSCSSSRTVPMRASVGAITIVGGREIYPGKLRCPKYLHFWLLP